MDISERTIYTWTVSVFFQYLLHMYHIVSVIGIALQIFVCCINLGVNVCR